MRKFLRQFFLLATVGLATAAAASAQIAATPVDNAATAPAPDAGASDGSEKIAPYQARFGRARPVIAVIGDNAAAELTDLVIPYALLRRSGLADVLAVATRPGIIHLRPALTIAPQATIAAFDQRYPDGADYVIVPAMVNKSDPALLDWLRAQAAKGGTMVSICDGALVLAGAGLLDGHRATAHWATEGQRRDHYPQVQWTKNTRYVVDGKVVSSAGISASVPVSLALVEAIGGRERAAQLAQSLGVADWGARHDSDVFHPRFGNLMAFATTAFVNRQFHASRSVGVPLEDGVDDIALALTADAYSRTGRSRAYTVAASDAPRITRDGLSVLPDRVAGGPDAVDNMLPALESDSGARQPMLDAILTDIAARYGRNTARGVALEFEYPGDIN